MKYVEPLSAFRRLALPLWAALAAMLLAGPSHAGLTDIAQTPILATTSAQVKPNIMLLMDASGSMARTHMPDEVEALVNNPPTIGYKAAQCNALYFNPTQNYIVPKRYTDLPFDTPSFGNAPYAGFGEFYIVPDTHTVNLNTKFVAYDRSTLEFPAVYDDPEQAAYYYVYTDRSGVRPDKLDFTSSLCTQRDNRRTDPTPDGGTWTRYDVSTRAAEQEQFAIWYSFYRTRLALIKSAASLAFAPLNGTRRVGFITVQPKERPDAPGIWKIGSQWPRFLPLADFNDGINAQKDLWFRKLFEQAPGGASPAREGLARVGRYYGSKEDHINTNMPATGDAAPIKYSCQQNFTIMTTDGYWNGQTESKGLGLYGGGLNLNVDGPTGKVEQQDGDIGDPYSPRPFWDGNSDSIRTTTDKTNAYTSESCSLANRFRTTAQTRRELASLTRDSTRTQMTTVQYYESKSQAVKATLQVTRTDEYDFKTTTQYAKHKEHVVQERYRHIKWQEQTLMTSEQYQLQTRQNNAQTFQTTRVDKQTLKTEEQWQTASSQSVVTTTQYAIQQDQYMLGRKQVYKHQYRTLAHAGDDETGVATEGDCVEVGNVRCETKDYFVRQLVDPADCTVRPGTVDVGTGPGFLKTTCENGVLARPYSPTDLCVTGVTPASSRNAWVETRCDYVPGTPKAFNGTCDDTAAPVQEGGPDYFIDICKKPAANNRTMAVSSCGVYPAPADPDWITTTCGFTGANNYAARPSLQCNETQGPVLSTDGQFITTTCTKPINTSGYAPTCFRNDGLSGLMIRVTCGVEQITFNAPVDKTTCSEGTFGTVARTCTRVPAGTYATSTPVQTCSDVASDGTPNFYETKCGNIDRTEYVLPGDCRNQTAADTNSWTQLDCTRPGATNFGPIPADPRLCIRDDGLVGPGFLHVTCATSTYLTRRAVPPSQCPLGPDTYGGDPDYVVTHCEKERVDPPTDVAACDPTDPDVDPYTVTVCGPSQIDIPVAFCVEGPLPDEGVDKVTCVRPTGPNNAGPTRVAVCNPQDPADSNDYVRVSCAGSRSDPPYAVDPANCTVADYGTRSYLGPTEIIHCASSGVAPYAAPTFVSPCTDDRSLDSGTLVVTVCSHPDATYNYTDRAVGPCSEVVNSVGANEVRTTCRKDTRGPDYVPTWTCPADVPQSGNGPAITCDTRTTLAEPVSSCFKFNVDIASPYDTTTDCHRVVTESMRDYAGICTDGPGRTLGEVVTCGEGPSSAPVADNTCTVPMSTNPGTGLITRCTVPSSGGGLRYYVTTTTTVNTQAFSGSLPVEPGAPDISTTDPVLVDNVCYAGGHDFSAIQPIPPAPTPPMVCKDGPAYPCYTSTATDGGSKNSLADVAQYYYKTDLRPDMTNDPDNGGVRPAGTGLEDDSATHQHMTTFVVGIGVSGTLNYRPDYRTAVTGDYADIRTGRLNKNWPIWPDPDLDKPLQPCGPPRPNTYQCNDSLYNDPRSIDDFWHAAVNGRGRFFSASNPRTVIQGLAEALATIDNKFGSGTADSVSTLQPTTSNNFAYSTSYRSGIWEGDVEARRINVANGVAGAAIWSAKELLGPRQGVDCDDRAIYVIHGGNSLSNFTASTKRCNSGSPVLMRDELDGTELANFGTAKVSQLSQFLLMTSAQKTEAQRPEHLVNFLRGQRANEGFEIDSATQFFRTRGKGVLGEGYLGDIVDSQPVYVGQPFASYQENNYADFKFRKALREPMIYVGANDGMLHAFYATTDLSRAIHGQEAWAIIPSAVLPNLWKLADDEYKRGDNHQFYVDGTPVAGDVWNGSEWRTILVGGLNAGGRGYYALDITDPGVLPTPLWEFKRDASSCPAPAPALMPSNVFGDCNLGLTFGKPIITKLGNEWVVMVTSGYNNNNGTLSGDGYGYLYVINALTGDLKYKISTGVGSFLTPSGLAQVNNYVDNVEIDNLTLRAYGGDVLGNIWRFDFPTPPAQPSATLLGIARDSLGNLEPITIRPELAELDGKPFVLVGTGKLLGGSDKDPTPLKQSVFGLRDTLGAGPVFPDPIRDVLAPREIAQTGAGATAVRTVRCAGSDADCERTRGWVLDLPEAGERVNVEMKLVLGALVFASNVPVPEDCSVGGHSWFNQVDFRTAKAIPGATSSEYLSDSLNVGFNVLQLPLQTGQQNPTYTGLFRQSKGNNVNKTVNPPPPPFQGNRISWREIVQ